MCLVYKIISIISYFIVGVFLKTLSFETLDKIGEK